MKYFKDTEGNVFAYESDGSQDGFIGNKTPMTLAELNTHLAPTTEIVNHAVVSKLQAVKYWQAGGLWASVKAMLSSNADLEDRWIAASQLNIDDPDVIALGAALEQQTGTTLQQMFNSAAAV